MKQTNYNNVTLRILLVLSFLMLTASALYAEDDFLSEDDLYGDFADDSLVVKDPLQPFNRAIFKFNDYIYVNVIRHVANGYAAITPDFIEKGASNFFQNLKYPVRLSGNLLQGRLKGARIETERFLVNTTLGVAGVYKAADHFKRMQPIEPEDIGQALGAWGIGEGPYLVLPLLGPSNLRDLFGVLGDRTVNPLDQPLSVIDHWDWKWQFTLGAADFVSGSPALMNLYMQVKENAIDPYSALKTGYTERRRAMVEN